MSARLGWLNDRQRDGGVDRVTLPTGVPGALFLCGKQAVATRYESDAWDTIVCLTERHELDGHYPDYVAWLDAAGPAATGPSPRIWRPIPDLHAPTLVEMRALAGDVAARLRAGERVLMHCAAGKGRAGTTAVCVLVSLGLDADEALAVVGTCRPGAGPEVGAQLDLVRSFVA